MRFIDLTHELDSGTPVYPGDEAPVFEDAFTLENDGFREKRFTMFSHTGTHMDAPAHMMPGAPALDELPLSRFAGSAYVMDISGRPAGFRIEAEDIERRGNSVRGNDFLVIKTGWEGFWGVPDYFAGFPVLTPRAAELLAGWDMKGVGLDCLSADPVDSPDYPVHRVLLGAGLVIIENLANLDALSSSVFHLSCFPLKIRDADGSPVRAVGIIDD